MNDHWTHYGRQRLADALASGESLAIVGDQLGKEFASPAGVAAFGGYISAALETLDRLRGAGFKFSGDPLLEMPGQGAALRLNGVIARREWDALGMHAGALLSALEGCRRWLVVRQPDPPPAPVKAPEPAPLLVQIVGMPDRLTSTEIARDAAGNIASSAQIERDAVPHE